MCSYVHQRINNRVKQTILNLKRYHLMKSIQTAIRLVFIMVTVTCDITLKRTSRDVKKFKNKHSMM